MASRAAETRNTSQCRNAEVAKGITGCCAAVETGKRL
jgi:hypothetical protein